MFNWILKRLKKNEKGFTLIELVIVIAILGILVFVAVPKLAGTTRKAAISAHNANVRTLESAATMYIAEKGLGSIEDGELGRNSSLASYVQEWPKTPKGAESEGLTGGEDYKVTIKADGDITVEPKVISIEEESNNSGG